MVSEERYGCSFVDDIWAKEFFTFFSVLLVSDLYWNFVTKFLIIKFLKR